MKSPGKRELSLTVHLVVRGAYGCVWLSDEAHVAYEALKARGDDVGIQEARSIKRYFDRFAEMGPPGLDNPKMFKPLGRYKDGTGKLVAVFEFKAFQWRLYGVMRHYRGLASFVGLCVDPEKKKDKADPAMLNRCARMSSKL